jgi:2-C-methyl-D-erythritol 4-phosphate cytidylyltransferase
LVRAQTPQGFPRDILERAHLHAHRAGMQATDDAALCEHLGFPVVVVPGSERAAKITTEDDFALLELLARLPA